MADQKPAAAAATPNLVTETEFNELLARVAALEAAQQATEAIVEGLLDSKPAATKAADAPKPARVLRIGKRDYRLTYPTFHYKGKDWDAEALLLDDKAAKAILEDHPNLFTEVDASDGELAE